MSREILFRGKRLDNGGWEESEYAFGTLSGGIVIHDFDPKTVCQYTGLTDKNGEKIFEGDICDFCIFDYFEGDIRHRGVVSFMYDSFIVRQVSEKGNRENFDHYPLYWANRKNHEFRVIGNIYDNPELLST